MVDHTVRPTARPTFRPMTVLGALVCALFLFVASASPAVGQKTIEELLLVVDDMMRGASSQGRMTMRVKTQRFERQLTMDVWSKGTEQSLVRIVSPARERGTATLRTDDQIWNYLPKVDRTIKVPASMMSASWMGSHFTNDDLVRQNRFSEDFECTIETDAELYRIRCEPFPDTPVVWGLSVVEILRSNELPTKQEFFDEDGALLRTLEFLDVRNLGGRELPTRMRVIPGDEDGEFTEVIYEDMRFDVDLPDRLFTLQGLKE